MLIPKSFYKLTNINYGKKCPIYAEQTNNNIIRFNYEMWTKNKY